MIFNSKKFFSRVAFIEKDKKITYKHLHNFSKKLNKFFGSQKCLIILDVNNKLFFLKTYFSLFNNNHAIMLIDSSISVNYKKNIIKKFKPKFFISSEELNKNDFEKKYTKIILKKDVFLYNFSYKNNYKIHKKIKFLLSTSGSLGEANFVKLSKKNVIENTKSIASYLDLKKTDTTITTLNPSYSYGFSVLNTHLFVGAKIIANEKTLFDKEFWRSFNQNMISNINGVPYFWEIANKIGINKFLTKNFRFLTVAGGAINAQIFQTFKDLQKNKTFLFFLMYGQTEASPRISYLKINKTSTITAPSIGKVIPGGKLYLKNLKGKKIKKTGIEGELIFEGKNIFKGYARSFKDLDKIKELKKLNTGDLAYLDKNLDFHIIGRRKRIAKIYGYRINLDYLEKEVFKNNDTICLFRDEKIFILSEKSIDLGKINNLSESIKKKIIIKLVKKLPRLKNNKLDYNIFDER